MTWLTEGFPRRWQIISKAIENIEAGVRFLSQAGGPNIL
jgi:hypothetical protein